MIVFREGREGGGRKGGEAGREGGRKGVRGRMDGFIGEPIVLLFNILEVFFGNLFKS